MTGFGTSRTQNRQFEIEVHVKSVNGRFLEIRFHLPKEYAPFENDFREVFTWQRGSVDVYVYRRLSPQARLQTADIRMEAAKEWATRLKRLAKSLNLQQEITLRDVLQMPYVLETSDRVNLFPGELKTVKTQIVQAAKRCQTLRQGEGTVLRKELLAQVKDLDRCLEEMEKCRDESAQSQEGRLKSRLSTLDSETLDSSRLALETALILDKMDVHEEIVRLREHVKACEDLINRDPQGKMAKGKKLDFYCQELLREVNTIGSKSQSAPMTKVVVNAKSVVEKLREQVQNIE